MSTEKRSLIFLLGLLLVLYLVKLPPLLDEYTMGRFIVWTILSFAGLWFLLPQFKRVDLQLLDLSLLGFYLINIISISWSQNFGEAILTSQKYLLLLTIYFVLRHLFAQGKVYREQTAKILIALSAFVIVLVSYQVITTFFSEGLGGKAVYKIIGFSGHKNLTASYLFLLFCFNIYFAIRRPTKAWFYWFLGIQVILILLLRSRAVYIAMGAFALIGGIYYLNSTAQLRQMAIRRLLPFTLVLVIFGGLIIGNTGVGKDYARYLNPSTYLGSSSGSERLFVWHKTWDLIVEQPILGYGSGNWKIWFPSKNISGGFRLQQKDLIFTRVHNDFLEVWAEVGTLGFLFFLAMFVLAMGGAIHHLRKGKLADQQEGIVLLATLVGFILISFFDFPKERPEHQVLLAVLLAICAHRGSGWFKKLPAYRTLSAKDTRNWALLLSLFMLVNLPIGYYRTLANISSEQVLIGMATKNTKLMREEAQKGGSIWYSVNPMVIPFSWYEGLAYYYEDNFAQARAPFADAYAINPYNFNIANNYASTLVQLGEYDQAIPLYLQALEINPKFEEGMFNLAFSYFQLKRYQEALDWVNKVEINQNKKAVFLQKIQEAAQ